MDANRATLQPVMDLPRCYLCDHELIAQVQGYEGGLVYKMVCPIHGTRGTNEVFNPKACDCAS